MSSQAVLSPAELEELLDLEEAAVISMALEENARCASRATDEAEGDKAISIERDEAERLLRLEAAEEECARTLVPVDYTCCPFCGAEFVQLGSQTRWDTYEKHLKQCIPVDFYFRG